MIVHAYYGGFVLVALLALFVLKVAAEDFGEGVGEVAYATDVDGYVVFFGGAGEGEWLVLEK